MGIGFPSDMSLGKSCHRDTNCLTEKRVGPTSSLGIIAGDCILEEDSPTTIPQRNFDGDRFPQRHVAGESSEMLLGKTPIVVVNPRAVQVTKYNIHHTKAKEMVLVCQK
ncbi:hypothetical protein Tco_1282205 [Tanacetum coccineum]